jgi:hypothetical protein
MQQKPRLPVSRGGQEMQGGQWAVIASLLSSKDCHNTRLHTPVAVESRHNHRHAQAAAHIEPVDLLVKTGLRWVQLQQFMPAPTLQSLRQLWQHAHRTQHAVVTGKGMATVTTAVAGLQEVTKSQHA